MAMNPGKISFHKVEPSGKPVFSILIPSWNNLPVLKVCIDSIRKNSFFNHQIIVHANQATDGTLEWLKASNLSFTYSAENAGVCYGFNAPYTLADSDYICLLDDDMYVCPGWDKALWDEIQKLDDHYFCLSGTLIQPFVTRYNCVIGPYNFGRNSSEFREAELLEVYDKLSFFDWNGCNWYPMVLHRRTWDLIGGLSIEFTPGMYSDPDFMMKLWQLGVRYFKGVSASRAYHFLSLSTSRVKKNNGRKQFLLKWGISSSTFLRYYLRIGTPFDGPLHEPERTVAYRRAVLRNKLNRIIVN
jgi:glycosyltransferase involved in cell wall biosynthesis